MSDSVLIVDDDDGIRTSLRIALEDRGYRILDARDAETALSVLADSTPDLMVLDLMLPGMDGLECCRLIRRNQDLPIIIVSARGDSHDVVAGLEAGADDYIRKPFAVSELAARLRALRRRSKTTAEATEVVAGRIVLRPHQGEVTVDGRPVHLTRTEFRLLLELASAPGRVFSREILLERVWSYDYFGDSRIVDVHVGRLRAKIEPDASAPQYLLTVRGFGYKIKT